MSMKTTATSMLQWGNHSLVQIRQTPTITPEPHKIQKSNLT